MKYVVACWAILSAYVLLMGALLDYTASGRMSLRVINTPRLFTVAVYLPDADSRYRWLSVHGCSAAVLESGAFCTGDFERESTIELTGLKHALIDWRDLPGGTMLVTAMAFDVNRRVLARQTVTVFRGR